MHGCYSTTAGDMTRKNILFIMCDQLRYDYLGCTGHPTIKTPNIDALAARGVVFSNTYCQAPTCGPSRSSMYTGRYMSSNGTSVLHAPLRVGEMNIGDHLNPLGVCTALVGKSHMIPDIDGMERLGIDPQSPTGIRLSQAGWEPYERDDGIHPDALVKPNLRYNDYLRSKGYDEVNPWHWAANAVETDSGIRSGYFNDCVDRPARVADEESETPYMTRRAMDFMAEAGDAPWLLHLSYIKPHWPYVAPAPYNGMYSAGDVIPAVRTEGELDNPNPLIGLFRTRMGATTFSRNEAREKVIPTYMGLITQIDDQLGLLFDFMENRGLLENTMIVFTSDHGDYLGDHWMGDKEYFHDQAVKIPLVVADPDRSADATRGSVDDALIEGVDLLPTFLDYFGGAIPQHVLEGRSLMPRLRGEHPPWREFAISENDYSFQLFGLQDGRTPLDCRSYMVVTKDWKYIYAPGFPPVLFDLVEDPTELTDLGQSDDHAAIRQEMFNRLAIWSLQYRQRVACTEERARHMSGIEEKMGVLIGYWNEDDAAHLDPKTVPRHPSATPT